MATFGGASGLGSSVETSEIEDGAVTNAKVNASAAIDSSKLVPLVVGVSGGVLPSTGVANAHISATAAITAAKMIESAMRYTEVTISSADILALHTTDKELIAAPGAGKIIVVDKVVFSFTAGTQYANGDNLNTIYAGESTLVASQLAASVITSASSSINARLGAAATGASNVVMDNGTNKAVNLHPVTATAFITGTGTLKAFIWYKIITL